MELVASCAFGVEAVLKREMQALGFTINQSENGRIYFDGSLEILVKANMALRTAERIFVVIAKKTVLSFDELYDFVNESDLKSYLGPKGKYIVNAKSVQSKLFSLRDIQSIVKKAIISNLKVAWKCDEFLENQEPYKLLINLQKDIAEIWLDTSGDALHKRGYRINQGDAPIKETLAASMVLLSFYDKNRTLYDPFCGSGTIAIEAAMIAKNMAPNLNRSFDLEHFYWFEKSIIKKTRIELMKAIIHDGIETIIASDIDHKAIIMANENAIEAGVDDVISFQVCAFELQSFDKPYGIIITNPPYGLRLETEVNAEELYHSIGKTFKTLQSYSFYMITAYPGIEGIFKKNADRTRVLFNGNIKARYYQYYGPRPL